VRETQDFGSGPDDHQWIHRDHGRHGGGIFQEFWPDISRKVLHRDPTHGLDAQLRTEHAAEKQAKKAALQQDKSTR
jgi:hypothetical protein